MPRRSSIDQAALTGEFLTEKLRLDVVEGAFVQETLQDHTSNFGAPCGSVTRIRDSVGTMASVYAWEFI